MRNRLFILVLLLCASVFGSAAETGVKNPASAAASTQTITLGGGCFWCLEAVFTELKGVQSVTSGYSGAISIEPHIAVVFHDATVKSSDEEMFNSFVEYGRRLMALVEDIQFDLNVQKARANAPLLAGAAR